MHSQSLDPQLWHACAGGMAQIPPPNSKVYYFPQGHAEHSNKPINFLKFPAVSPLILCRVAAVKYFADSETDEVFAKIRLIPLNKSECENVCDEDESNGFSGFDDRREKNNSFAKTLTPSDANNGGGFSVPRFCAETIFPRLDYSAEPPVQTILAKDAHGVVWKFRHIYRGTPRRHLLTTGWSNFVGRKRLVAGDSVVFLRAENGDLCVGIRRAKKGISGGGACGWNAGGGGACGWNTGAGGGGGNVEAEDVVEAASLAASGRAFEVVYYPRAGSPEFVVRAAAVTAAMRRRFCAGMRFKMAFETEDSSRISWFMGTISCVSVDNPIHWPNSPWRLLEVVWDEPDLLQNVKRVNPWLVELVSTMAAGRFSPFSPPRKRARLPQQTELPEFGQLHLPTLFNNTLSPNSPLCHPYDNIPAGVQGARHARFDLLPSDLHLKMLDYSGPLTTLVSGHPFQNPDYEASTLPKRNEAKTPMFVLFGKPILTAEQIAQSRSEDTRNASGGSGSVVVQNSPPEASSEGAGPTLDPGIAVSGEELERSELSSNVVYNDARRIDGVDGDELFL